LTANVKLSERKEGQKEKKTGLDIANLYLQGGRQQRTGSRDSARWIKYLQKLRRHDRGSWSCEGENKCRHDPRFLEL